MSITPTIRKFIAGLLLAVFAFGITPKRTLHNLIATHKDGKAVAATANSGDTNLSKAAFNCQCDNLVVESPFVPELATLNICIPGHSTAHQPGKVQGICLSSCFSFGLRGPPAVA